MTETQKRRALVQFSALCYFLFVEGWNDGSSGPLLPRIQKVYNVDYTIVSLIFVFACVGFISGAISNVYLGERLGFGKVMVLAASCQVIAYSIEAAAPPFPAFVAAFAINGFGLAIQNAQAVGYTSCFKDKPEARMGFIMSCYGAGALCAPLVATQFSALPRWSFHYLASLGLAVANWVVMAVVFKGKTQDECLEQIGLSTEKGTSDRSQMRQIMALKDVHLLAAFILFYVGAEVTIGGWIVTYIIDVRGGGASSGYISTGFFAGLAIGRVGLLWVNKKIGERLALFIYAILCIICELIVWFVPSLAGDAVAVAIVGFFFGPMYPIAMNHARRVFPRWILTGSVGWIAGVGQAGSALVPFMAGAVASKAGIKTLQPVLVGIIGLMTALWALVPKGARRPD
ncbi:MFS general substrate transporter [Coniophora puteana RWD-64-598 SS2]|uniref:MFS general substrate transporter n=1 Tax=Coniophora puteana (strain RWD-64-598) TaxID=741705 RepID=A0A5M3N3F4_CONPW|nr:MFS general substrate transporter [Coniophora puteana RWD-64-598 SS2]EIW85949.1 MFS general substrate transporter [Coniophora puteana RWD-64-598 SS2]